MAYEVKPNTGNLFHQKVKKNPKAPDYTGELLIDLDVLEVKNNKVKVRIAGWKKTSEKGTTYLSLNVDTFKPKSEEQPHAEVQDEEDPF